MSLRESKKRALIMRVQDEAFRLASVHGYEGTTIDAVAAAAGVSPSTLYRTFGTKEGLFLWDELEMPAIEALEDELAHHTPVEAVIAVVGGIGGAGFHLPADEMRVRLRFVFTEPALRCARRDAFAGFEETLAKMFVRRGTVEPREARIISAAGMAAMISAGEEWALADPPRDFAAVASEAAASLRAVLSG
jgi:AcrR family transcriptional regulator